MLQALIDDPETVESELKWVSDLLDGLRAWPEMREQFEPIGTITRKESDWALPHIAQAEPEDDEHRDALLCHAVRMFRLNAFCRRLADEAPLKPRLRRGPAPKHYTRQIVDDAERYRTKDKMTKKDALTKAMDEALKEERISDDEYVTAFETIYNDHL